MSITALDIQQEGFEHSIRGYDVVQVDDFLERVAQEVDNLNNTITDLESQLEEAKEAASKQTELALDEAKIKKANEKQLKLAKRAEVRAHEAETRAREAEARAKQAEKEAEELQEKLAPLQQKLTEKSEMDAVISNAIISAQRSADTLKESARAEGERLYRESEAKARELIRTALGEKQRILAEVDSLQLSAEKFRENYKRLLSRFNAQAQEGFNALGTPKIPDNIIDDMLPKYEEIDLGTVDEDTRYKSGSMSGISSRSSSASSKFSFDDDLDAASELSSFSKESFGTKKSFGASSKLNEGGRKKTGNTGVIAASMSELLDDTALIDDSDD